MKLKLLLSILPVIALSAYTIQKTSSGSIPSNKLNGTWRLVSSKVVTNGVSETTFPVKGQEMIKMFNGTHFAFFKHDINKGKGGSAIFESGSGTYSLSGNEYSEHLAYCNYRDWEDRDFKFTVQLQRDTLIQRGIEKIDSLNVNHEIIEVYVKTH
jgi:hypothetical protein